MVTPTPTVSQFGSIIVARWPGEFSQFDAAFSGILSGAVTVNTVRLEPKPWGYIRTQPTIRKECFHDYFCAATVDYLFDLQLCLWYATMISEDRNADFRYGSIV